MSKRSLKYLYQDYNKKPVGTLSNPCPFNQNGTKVYNYGATNMMIYTKKIKLAEIYLTDNIPLKEYEDALRLIKKHYPRKYDEVKKRNDERLEPLRKRKIRRIMKKIGTFILPDIDFMILDMVVELL